MRRRTRIGTLLTAALLLLAADLAVVAGHDQDWWQRNVTAASAARALPLRLRPSALQAAAAPVTPAPKAASSALPSAVEPTSTTTTSTTLPPTTTSTVPPAPVRGGAWTLGPYEGLGVWVDVYDWTLEMTRGNPRIGPEQVDQMADLGIETLFLQTSHRRSASDVMEPDRLLPIIERAHARGMAVVGWYLPMLTDLDTDFRRLVAASALPLDGLGVDIESLEVSDPAERTRRLLQLSAALKDVVGARPLAAITPDAVHLQVVNPGFWPGFPWAELDASYDVIVPMAYWSIRKPEWKVGDKYVYENIDRIRAATGGAVPIHVAGGIADGVTPADLSGMTRAVLERQALGGSLYDWNTSNAEQWAALAPLRFALR